MSYDEINHISKLRLEIDLDDYVTACNTPITIAILDTSAGEFNLSSGNTLDYEVFKEYIVRTGTLRNKTIVAGYYSKVCDDADLKLSSDIIFTNRTQLTNKNQEFCDLIIIHELCHLIEKTNYKKLEDLPVLPEDRHLGQQIQIIANKIDQFGMGYGDPHHNETFGTLLSYFVGVMNFDQKHDLLNKSLLPNFLDDYSETYKSIIDMYRVT